MSIYHYEKLLILTKTYPSPSLKYRETSCVAALNQKGEMRRIFPVPFRLLDGQQQFQRWEWIKARVAKATGDNRPESYRIDVDSIQRLSKIGTENAWAERIQWISPHMICSFDAIEARRQATGETLGFIRPSKVNLIIKKSDQPDWTPEENEKLIKDGLFDSEEVRQRNPLRKVPYDFYYTYESFSDGSLPIEYTHKITDWEVCALYWRCIRDYGNDWEIAFRNKLQDEFSQTKDLIFLMGTMHRFRDKWLIVGLIYPPKVEARQQALFLPCPND
ncbi:hypothetical protein ADN00_18755 [Ornatilinea apprima]|uniref:Uncharacterized protein n=1 Tax=Ornatilinea apprima TaxID=1134406 RepID=A0A0P6WMR0_9CHLR|nr:hypothetical protein [Ornatilinea apprima]KPL70085.1 hypothetical protein ADN00_18755 [Ornatilinea apprima]